MTEETVTLSRADYEHLLAEIEDLRDALELAQAKREHDGVWIPGEVVFAETLDGRHPVTAWRVHRGLTVHALAAAAGLASDAVAAFEAGATSPTAETLRALSQALDAPVDALIPAET